MTGRELRVAVVGAGYVGVATAMGLAERAHRVVVVARGHELLATLADDWIPAHERVLPDAYAMYDPRFINRILAHDDH